MNRPTTLKETSGLSGLGEGGGWWWRVNSSRGPPAAVCKDEGDALRLSGNQFKEGFSHSESSTGKSTTFKLTVTVITAVSCQGLELIATKCYKAIIMTGLITIKRQARIFGALFCPFSQSRQLQLVWIWWLKNVICRMIICMQEH